MAKKTVYRAAFSTGDHIKRHSERAYTHAWAIFRETQMIETGFSGSRELAEKAAHACLPTDHEAAFKKKNKYRTPYCVQATLKWLKEYHEGSWAKYQEHRQALLARLRIEIVEVTS